MRISLSLIFFFLILGCSFKQNLQTDSKGFLFKPQVYDFFLNCNSKPVVFLNTFTNVFFFEEKTSISVYGQKGCHLSLSFKLDSENYILEDSLNCEGECEIPVKTTFSNSSNYGGHSLSCSKVSLIKPEKLIDNKTEVKIFFLLEEKQDSEYGPLYQSCSIDLKKIDF